MVHRLPILQATGERQQAGLQAATNQTGRLQAGVNVIDSWQFQGFHSRSIDPGQHIRGQARPPTKSHKTGSQDDSIAQISASRAVNMCSALQACACSPQFSLSSMKPGAAACLILRGTLQVERPFAILSISRVYENRFSVNAMHMSYSNSNCIRRMHPAASSCQRAGSAEVADFWRPKNSG